MPYLSMWWACLLHGPLQMSSAKTSGWRDVLDRAANKAKAEVIGHRRIEHAQHGLLVATALEAFGDDPRALFFIETTAPATNIPRPDLILLHPDVGILVIENKGLRLDDIHEVRGTSLSVLRDGQFKNEDPFHQSERVVFRLKDLTSKRANLNEALFLNTVTLPLIQQEGFSKRFEVRWPEETLFAEACSSAKAFKAHIAAFANRLHRSTGKSHRLSKHARNVVVDILMGRGLFYAPRSNHIDDANPKLLGSQIQELEVSTKEPTQQQKELGRADLRGSHRLFRGVAGSGKSIMLALNAAHTLLKLQDERAGLFDRQSAAPKVLVVCFNKTLVHYLRQKIEERFTRLAWDAPPDGALSVTYIESLIRSLEAAAPALKSGMTFEQKELRARSICAAWDKLDETERERLRYDAIYIDEAQDLHPAEIELLLRLARRDSRGGQTFVVFYDNAQNIYGVTPPVWQQLGVDIVGRTVFLDQCLRNTTETLSLAFNVLVGSFAPEGERVTTRLFADVASLRQRGLITEVGDRFEIHFAPRSGQQPRVDVSPSGQAELDGLVERIKQLVTEERVALSDILVLYNSPRLFKDVLPNRLREALGGKDRVRVVDKHHGDNKSSPLIEDGVLTISTIASAKGYDAPVVFLVGADELDPDTKGRASFYVSATRAKLNLFVSGVKTGTRSLLDEIVLAANALAPLTSARPMEAAEAAPTTPIRAESATSTLPIPEPEAAHAPASVCRHCGSQRLHAQHGRFGYYFKCIDCTESAPIDKLCAICGKEARIRKKKADFFRGCESCGTEHLVHTNMDLQSLETRDQTESGDT